MLHLRFETWSVAFPEEWEHGIEDDILAIAMPRGESVLQIGSMSKDDGAVTDDDLWDFMDDIGAEDGEIERVALGDFEGLTATRLDDEGFQRYWIMRGGETLLLASLRASGAGPEADLEGAEDVLRSLRLEPPRATAH
jgi:hypothetical protein